MAEKKFAPIIKIYHDEPQKTAYGRALTMGWFGKASPDNAKTNAGIAVKMITSMLAVFGGICSIIFGMGFIAGASVSALGLAWPALFATSLAALHICARRTDRENKKLLADPTETFDWQIAKAVKSFNKRATSFNAILAAVELDRANVPEDELARVYGELSSAREELSLNIKMLEGMRQATNVEPELSANLEELRDAKEVLMRELRQSEHPAEALLVGKIREALQIESTYRELPLLPEAKK